MLQADFKIIKFTFLGFPLTKNGGFNENHSHISTCQINQPKSTQALNRKYLKKKKFSKVSQEIKPDPA